MFTGPLLRFRSTLPPQKTPFSPQITTDFTSGSRRALVTVSVMPRRTAALANEQILNVSSVQTDTFYIHVV